jgi:hypothetical protein
VDENKKTRTRPPLPSIIPKTRRGEGKKEQRLSGRGKIINLCRPAFIMGFYFPTSYFILSAKSPGTRKKKKHENKDGLSTGNRRGEFS